MTFDFNYSAFRAQMKHKPGETLDDRVPKAVNALREGGLDVVDVHRHDPNFKPRLRGFYISVDNRGVIEVDLPTNAPVPDKYSI